MFNGIIFNQGKIRNVLKRKKGINIFVYSKLKISKKDIGMSISCDGVCLTLISLKKAQAELKELLRTTFEKHSRQIKELYSLYHKIDDAYCSGLATCDVENDEYNFNVCSETEPNDIFPIK